MKIKTLYVIVFCLVAAITAISGCSWERDDDPVLPPQNPEISNDPVLTHQGIVDDMLLPNDGHPAGVPSNYSWYSGSSSWWQEWNRQWMHGPYLPKGWKEIIAWGQVFADSTQPNVNKDYPNVRVHLKELDLWIYQDNDTWIQIGGGETIFGHDYVENFVGDVHKPSDIKYEEDGGISVQAGDGYCFHFWPHNGEYEIDKLKIKAVFVTLKARLIGVKANQDPKYLVAVGADYWIGNGADHAGLNQNNTCVGMGRHKYVTEQWQYFTMHTFTPEEVGDIVFPN